MKAWLLIAPALLIAPNAAFAQSLTDAEEERKRELGCQLLDVCGDLADAEAVRSEETEAAGEMRGANGGALSLDDVRELSRPAAKPKPAREVKPRTRPLLGAERRAGSTPSWRKAPRIGVGAAEIPESMKGRGRLTVTFALNSDKLTPGSMSEIRSFAAVMQDPTMKAAAEGKRFRIEGHSDSSGSDAYNRDLSERRAASVRAALIEAGFMANQIEAVGLGEERPLEGYNGSNPLNRRVEAVVVD